MNTLLAIALVALMSQPTIDISAHKVTTKKTAEGGIYFHYTLKNNGLEEIAGGDYTVKLKVNGKTISFDKATGTIKPGKTVEYTSSRTYYASDYDKLEYQLIIKARDDRKENNTLTGTVQL